jgi:hypothetical protein
MTHDELLARIDKNWDADYDYCDDRRTNALRAVVELHKPWSAGSGDTSIPPVTYTPKCLHCNRLYPCDTIQAIEKELA